MVLDLRLLVVGLVDTFMQSKQVVNAMHLQLLFFFFTYCNSSSTAAVGYLVVMLQWGVPGCVRAPLMHVFFFYSVPQAWYSKLRLYASVLLNGRVSTTCFHQHIEPLFLNEFLSLNMFHTACIGDTCWQLVLVKNSNKTLKAWGHPSGENVNVACHCFVIPLNMTIY